MSVTECKEKLSCDMRIGSYIIFEKIVYKKSLRKNLITHIFFFIRFFKSSLQKFFYLRQFLKWGMNIDDKNDKTKIRKNYKKLYIFSILKKNHSSI